MVIEANKKESRETYDLLVKEIPQFAEFTFLEFQQVIQILQSRTFGVYYNDQKEPSACMVPLADMGNHQLPMKTYWNYDKEKDGFYIEALEDIKEG